MAKRFLSNIRINDAYTFPASDGTNNQVIKTDGSGNLTFGQLATDSASVIHKDIFTGDGSTTIFNMVHALNDENQSNIYIDGVYQSKSTYSIANKAITFSTAPLSGHEIEVISTTGINSGPTAIYTDTFTANGSTTAFTLAQTVHNENQTLVFLNGVYQFKGTYTLSGTTLTLDTAPSNGVAIEVMSIGSAYSGGDILYDHDFASAGLMTTDGSGTYSISTDSSANWNTAYGWGDHGLSAQDKIDIGNLSGTNTGDQTLTGLSYAAPLGADDNYVTDAQLVVISNTSGTNTGDQDLSTYATQTYVGTQITNLGNSTEWNTAYDNSITALAVSGTTTKTLTATQQDGGTLTASWTDNNTGGTVTSVAVTAGTGITASVANSTTTPNITITNSAPNIVQTSVTGNAGTATILQTARTLTIGSTGKTFDGSANVSWTLAEIGVSSTNVSNWNTAYGWGNHASAGYAAASHTHSVNNITDGTRWWNNFGDNYSTRTAFDATTPSYGFGWRYVQGTTNSPGVNGASQYYSLYVGLGNDYPATGAGSYGMQVAFPRNVTTPYLSIRYNESNSLGSWQKISAGYADSAGTATNVAYSGLTGTVPTWNQNTTGNANTTSQQTFNDLKINFPSGTGGGYSFGSNHYSMGLDQGNNAWYTPHYRDLIIGYHTGVRIGAHYSGIRFYNDSPTTDANNDGNGDSGEALLMTIGGYVGTANHTDVTVNNNLFANVSMRTPIFYDSANTAYYLDPASTSNLSTVTAAQFNGPLSGNAATATGQQSGTHFTLNTGGGGYGLVGVYNPDIHQGFYSMGSAYTLGAGGTLASFYGVSWSYDYSGRQLNTGYNLQHCMAVANAGVVATVIGLGIWTNGIISSSTDMRAPIFYDSDNTAYYVDPSSVSNMNQVKTDALSVNTNGSQTTKAGLALYGAATSGEPTYGMMFTGTSGSGTFGGVNADWATYFTMNATTGRGWIFRNVSTGNVASISNTGWAQFAESVRAPIFYDSNDTSYYIDSASDRNTNINGFTARTVESTKGTYKYNIPRYIHTSGTDYWVGSMGWGTTDLNVVGTWGSGFFDTWSNPANQPSGTSHWVGIQAHHYVSGSNYAHAWQMCGGPTGNLRFRNAWPYWSSWKTIPVLDVNDNNGGAMYAGIYYDANNTGYYVDPASTSNLNTVNIAGGTFNGTLNGNAATATGANGNFYIDDNYGNTVVGLYASTRYQGVWAMGDAYKLSADGTTTGNLYGLAWSHPHTGGVAANLNDHGLLVINNGVFAAAISSSIRAATDMRAPVFYDSNNTGYYVDPSGGTNLNGNTRITNTRFGVSTSGTFAYTTGYGFHSIENHAANEPVCMFYQQTTGDHYGINVMSAGNPNNTTSRFFLGQGASSERIKIYSNGNIQNANNSYGQLSDINLKENVVDATPKLDELNKVRIVNFNYIGDIDKETNTPNKQIGVIAQELEEIFPSMVYECGDTEVPTKSVKYSVLVPILVKAIQEQQIIINDLKLRIEKLEL